MSRILGLVCLSTLLLPSVARAGGFELIEQSPTGVATAGAQGAVAEEPSTVYYNPAGLTFQRGLALSGGFVLSHSDVMADAPSGRVSGGGTLATPSVFLTQRLGPYFGAGIGIFSNFAEQLDYPDGWAGRASGTRFYLTTTTINVAVAIRPIPQVSVGFGLNIMPASLELARGISTAGGDGSAHSTGHAVGIGGNVAVLVQVVPQYLRLGATYRSSIDLDFSGHGALEGPGIAEVSNDVTQTLPLPHNFGLALSAKPIPALTLSLDGRLTLWHDLGAFNRKFTDPNAGQSVMPTTDSLTLNQRDSWAVRLGGEYRLLDEKLRVRLGVGFDTSPVRRGWLGPLTPDSNRVIAGAGLGYAFGVLSADVGYSVQFVLERTSTNPDPGMASYSAVRHIVSAALTVRLPDFGGRINVPEYKH